MINTITKNQIYQKFKVYRSFIILLILATSTIIIVNIYDKFRSEQFDRLENLLQNIYFQKTFESISQSLEPRYEKITHIVKAGDSFESILDELNFGNKEKKKVVDYLIKKKNKK